MGPYRETGTALLCSLHLPKLTGIVFGCPPRAMAPEPLVSREAHSLPVRLIGHAHHTQSQRPDLVAQAAARDAKQLRRFRLMTSRLAQHALDQEAFQPLQGPRVKLRVDFAEGVLHEA